MFTEANTLAVSLGGFGGLKIRFFDASVLASFLIGVVSEVVFLAVGSSLSMLSPKSSEFKVSKNRSLSIFFFFVVVVVAVAVAVAVAVVVAVVLVLVLVLALVFNCFFLSSLLIITIPSSSMSC